MDETTPARIAAPFTRCLRWARSWAALWHDIVGSWRYALARAAPQRIDPATLRDLGLHRSELGSYRAELDGRAEATRCRVIAQQRGL